MKKNLIIVILLVFSLNGFSTGNNLNNRNFCLNRTLKINTKFSIEHQFDSSLDIDLLLKENYYSNCFKKPTKDQFLFNNSAGISNFYSQNLALNNTLDNRSNEVKYIVGCTVIGALMGYVLADKLSRQETALRGGLIGLGVGVVYVFSF